MKKNEFKTFMLVFQYATKTGFMTQNEIVSYELPVEYPFTLNDFRNIYKFLTEKYETTSIVLSNVFPIRDEENDGK